MKKAKRFITSMLLIMAVCVITVNPAFAAETADETWTLSNGSHSAAYWFQDTNTTSVKTMGNSGTVVVSGSFGQYDSATNSRIKLTVEIRDYPSGVVIGRGEFTNTNYPNGNLFMVTAPVKAGQQIQIFFDASSVSNPPGYLRSAWVDYAGYLTS